MRRRLFANAAALLWLGVAAAAAEPATPDGAKAIAAAYAAYFGPAVVANGVVTVAPDGDDYVVSWDIGKAIAAMDGPSNVEAPPLVYRITPTLDGGWLARASRLPSLTVGSSRGEGGTAAFDGFRFDGLFDPTAPEFFRSKVSLGAFKLDLKTKTTGDDRHVMLSEDGVAGELRVKPGDAPDSVDVRASQSMVSAAQKTAIVGEDGDEAAANETRQGAATGESAIADLRAKAFGDLWRFLVAHNSDRLPSADELRPKLAALLPLWKEITGQFHLDDAGFAFPGGGVHAKSADEQVRITGLLEQSSAALGFAVEELTVDVEAAPDWTKAIWPVSFKFQLATGVSGLDRAARLALDDEQFLQSGKLGDDAKAQILQTLVAGRPHIAVSETRLATPLGDATFEGDATFGEDGPEAQAKVTVSDLDKLMETLAKASETQPSAQQLLYLATFARGLAKTEDGRLVWSLEYVAPNGIRVNGQLLAPN